MAAVNEQGRPDWPVRPWILGGIGAVAALAVHFLVGERVRYEALIPLTLAVFVSASATLFAFTLERERWRWAVVFSLVAGGATALILYLNGSPADWSDVESWRFLSIFLCVAIAAPLFQAARDAGGLRFPYAEAHDHAFTNVVIWIAGWIFVGIVFLLALLLSELFALIKISLLKELLDKEWFWRPLMGGAFGTAVGVLREQDRIVRPLQRVIVAILAVLAPVLAIGLVLFLASLPFTGLDALWSATRSTTPILLSCIVGALILANGVIGNGEDTRLKHRVLGYAAVALGVVILPLAVIALVSTLTRVGQYGFTPDRLWAITFDVIAIIYGAAYLAIILWKRRDWMEAIRPVNMKLAIGLCALALFLALPILNFNAISTRDQVARLESGKVRPDRFDWAALRFDFGASGQKALDRLAKSPNAAIRAEAERALKVANRWDLREIAERRVAADTVRATITVKPKAVPLPDGLLEAFSLATGPDTVNGIYYEAGADTAVLVVRQCKECAINVSQARRLPQGGWDVRRAREWGGQNGREAEDRAAEAEAIREGRFTIETVTRKQVFLDGKPVGETFE